MITASIFEARTNLSNLLNVTQSGEVAIVAAGRSKPPR